MLPLCPLSSGGGETGQEVPGLVPRVGMRNRGCVSRLLHSGFLRLLTSNAAGDAGQLLLPGVRVRESAGVS